jgi:hypothetical protein
MLYTGDAEEALLIHTANVTGVQPALFINGFACLLFVVKVATGTIVIKRRIQNNDLEASFPQPQLNHKSAGHTDTSPDRHSTLPYPLNT